MTRPFPSRRALLKGAGAASIAAVFAPRARASKLEDTTVPEVPGPMIERTSRPLNYEAPLDVFSTRITPTDRFYIRNHFDLPTVDLETWRLSIEGLVDKPYSLGLPDLERLPQITVEAVLQCAGNRRGMFLPHVAGVQWQRGAMGNATWTGPRLSDVLARAGVKPEGKHLELQGLDRAPVEATPKFIRGIPIEKGLHEDTIVALRMNNAPLPLAHGYPARLVVPGWVGDDWMKWLTRIAVLADEPKGFFYETAYRYPATPGAPGAPVPPEEMKPMQQLAVTSTIVTPLDGDLVAPGPLTVQGVAHAGERPVTQVDVSFDGGQTWNEAALEPGSKYGFRVFTLTFEATPGKLPILSRATDEGGAVQPSMPVWNPSGYLHNAMDVVHVEVRR